MRRILKAVSRGITISAVIGGGVAFGGYWLVRYLRPRYSPLVLNDAVVVITGASSGIGRALAVAFAQRGARLVLNARRAELLEALRKEIAPYASQVHLVPGDLTDPAVQQTLVSETLARFGKISILVNNAGLVLTGPLELNDPTRIDALLDLNLKALIQLTRLAIPHITTRGRGIVVNIASVAGRAPAPGYAVYAASKYGVMGFTDALRMELFGTGVQVVGVALGYVRTDMNPPEMIRHMKDVGLNTMEAEEAADQIIHGLLVGKNELLIADIPTQLVVQIGRYIPGLLGILVRYLNSPQHIDQIRKQSGTRLG
jgi:short-subunit dehydrogenase